MPADLQQLIRDVESLTSDELLTLRQKIDSLAAETPEEKFSRLLRERGVVTQPRVPRDPNRPPNPTPIVAQGEPVSETLIRERR